MTQSSPAIADLDPRLNRLVMEMIGRIADKWTMAVIEVLSEAPGIRFTRLAGRVPGISQKMLTQTLRQLERDGMVIRTVHPVVPPRVDYRLTEIGRDLAEAFCGVWTWAETHRGSVEAARQAYDAGTGHAPGA